jgi:hypothetical protein
MNEIWDKFGVGFWHPFGLYAGLSPTEILEWKANEARVHGWTFWSFAYTAPEAWLTQLALASGPFFVLCSHSRGARDPNQQAHSLFASEFRYVGGDWQAMPAQDDMKVTNPFKRGGLALAFKVARVHLADPHVPPIHIEWFSRGQACWRRDSVPTRGEFLIRRGGNVTPRTVSAVLELEAPYLVVLRPGKPTAAQQAFAAVGG